VGVDPVGDPFNNQIHDLGRWFPGLRRFARFAGRVLQVITGGSDRYSDHVVVGRVGLALDRGLDLVLGCHA
jgi:hypothetical protein